MVRRPRRAAALAAVLGAAALACGGPEGADVEQPSTTGCRELVCHCTVLDTATLAPRLELGHFSARACTDQPWLEASRLCRAAVGVPCTCSTCDPAPP
ncbi:MAG TPA: hypothetical protein VFP65_27125 [Anaeromyxobacteraceae bacterium]|nr:hypothetical protein [Anaeromyxobacteraceae bacterium]